MKEIEDLRKAGKDLGYIYKPLDPQEVWPKTFWGVSIRIDPSADPHIITIEKRVVMDPKTIDDIVQKEDQFRKEHPELCAYIDNKMREYANQFIRELSMDIRR